VERYLQVLKRNYASRVARAFSAEDFAGLFADPDRPTLFPPAYGEIRTVLCTTGSEPPR
jgi:hypothetical protein